jgi:hypothetical protein
MSFLPVGRRRQMESQLFKLADDQLPQPDLGSVYMDTGSSAPVQDMSQSFDQPVQLEHSQEVPDSSPQSLREFVFAQLADLGVEQRHLTDPKTSKRIFSKKEVLGSNTVAGHFMIPSATAQGRISESDAKQIASGILQKFDLEGELGHEGRNYIVSFRSRKPDEPSVSGDQDSFAELAGEVSVPKTASTVMEELYMQRKTALADALKKAGYGR